MTNEDAAAAGTNSNWITMGTITWLGQIADGFKRLRSVGNGFVPRIAVLLQPPF